MKIAINYKLKKGSWGGGNQFVTSLVKASLKKGFVITFDLKERDIDIILLIDPRSYTSEVTFGSFDVILYLLFRNYKTIVVHRINECDERKNTKYINRFLKWTNYCSDFTVFISSWLKSLDIYQQDKPHRVILNGGDTNFFQVDKEISWKGDEPLKLVTHHWSPNLMKGFDVYRDIDALLNNEEFMNKIEFTYIGNLPYGFKFQNSRHIEPISGKKLGLELSKNHVYISASINEPAGMHHIEGALCGLPIIYRESGALPEYCMNYGISFKKNNYLPAINEMFLKYPQFKRKITFYPYTAKKMTDEYLTLFTELVGKRKEIIKNRNLFRKPSLLIKNFLLVFLKINNIVKFLKKMYSKRIMK